MSSGAPGASAPAVLANKKQQGSTVLPTKRQESILELAKLLDQRVRVKCLGGREVKGALRGYDDLVNLVLEDCDEFLRDPHDPNYRITNETRKLGLVVIRGTQVSLVAPEDGMEEIENPFLEADGGDDEAGDS
mmetsp:Transcript_3929/g.5169  ORF Transcript_3929/g.5169 Transcript_3929/m.5169 type:complete len:133 (-) Transcript_3929:228-626(-)